MEKVRKEKLKIINNVKGERCTRTKGSGTRRISDVKVSGIYQSTEHIITE